METNFTTKPIAIWSVIVTLNEALVIQSLRKQQIHFKMESHKDGEKYLHLYLLRLLIYPLPHHHLPNTQDTIQPLWRNKTHFPHHLTSALFKEHLNQKTNSQILRRYLLPTLLHLITGIQGTNFCCKLSQFCKVQLLYFTVTLQWKWDSVMIYYKRLHR